MRMNSLADVCTQLAKYIVKLNNIPKICLNFKSHNEILENYLSLMQEKYGLLLLTAGLPGQNYAFSRIKINGKPSLTKLKRSIFLF